MNDLNLVVAAKEGDQKSVELLYKKFYPLIKKYSKISGDEDFEQNAYFTLLQAIAYVKPEKIPEYYRNERWGFIRTFQVYLLNQVRSSIKTVQKRQSYEASNPCLVSNELGLPTESVIRCAMSDQFPQHELRKYDPEKMVFSTGAEEKYASFKKSLTNLEAELLQYRQEGKTLNEISSIWKLPIGKVKTMLINLKRRASHYFEVEYQYS